MKLIKATEAEIQQFIAQHTAWSVEEDKLVKSLQSLRSSLWTKLEHRNFALLHS
jgi:hypothetical protein